MMTPEQEKFLRDFADKGIAEQQAAVAREAAIEQAEQDAVIKQQQLAEAAAKAQEAAGAGFTVEVTPVESPNA